MAPKKPQLQSNPDGTGSDPARELFTGAVGQVTVCQPDSQTRHEALPFKMPTQPQPLAGSIPASPIHWDYRGVVTRYCM